MSNLKALMNKIPQTGKVEWISIRPKKWADVKEVEAVEVNTEEGLIGDHYSGRSGKRHVTLIQSEHLEVVGKILGKDKIKPNETRRNIVVSGINLLAFKEKQFQIGEVILEMTGNCHPCSRMEENFGEGGYNAMRGHGGITAKVIRGGRIQKGDSVTLFIG
ncbi:MAG: MOSC domain-containing protein [Bacteroidetes bacterium]|jgi:MOSC domain-containing protein YiiM|nr:MOSC domain-containing protein [Bacteroidota bacterium]